MSKANMKTAYELALERLGAATPIKKLTLEQKKQLAEVDSQYAAKVAERELALREQIGKATGQGDFEKAEQLQQELARERRSLQAELEKQKEEVRQRR